MTSRPCLPLGGGGSSAIVGKLGSLFAKKSMIASEFLLEFDASLAIATLGLRTNLPCRWKLLPEVFLGILYAKKRCRTYSCILGAPNTLGNLLFAEKHRLGENLPNIFRYLGVTEYFR